MIRIEIGSTRCYFRWWFLGRGFLDDGEVGGDLKVKSRRRSLLSWLILRECAPNSAARGWF